MSKIRVIRRNGNGTYTPAAVRHVLNDDTPDTVNGTTTDDPMDFTPYRFQTGFQRQEESVWENKIDTVCACEKAPSEVVVHLSFPVRRKIDLLMTKFKSQEWLAYLVGKEDKIVDDLYIPKQRATTGNVSDIDSNIPDGINIIGVIHSHHGMGAFFSGTDDDFINKNYNLSIVVSHTEMKGQFRYKVPCGALKIVPVKVQTIIPKLFDEDEFSKEADDKINPVVSPIYKSWTPAGGWQFSG